MNIYFRNALLLIIGSFLLLAGCGKDDTSTNPDPTTITFKQPTVGDRCDYRFINGADTNSFYYQVTQKYSGNVFQAKQVITYKTTGTEIDTLYWYVTTDEWKEVSDPAMTYTGMRLFSSMELNKEYIYYLLPSSRWGNRDTVSYKLLARSEQVTVPAGTFNCFKLSMKGTGASQMPETTIFFSPLYGQIRISNQYSLVEMISKTF